MTKPSPIWTTYIILHETTGADCFLSNHSTIHWYFNCIERSMETEMVSLTHSWTEQNHDDRWEILHRQCFGMPKKVAGPTCYGVKQFQFLKHGILPRDISDSLQIWNDLSVAEHVALLYVCTSYNEHSFVWLTCLLRENVDQPFLTK